MKIQRNKTAGEHEHRMYFQVIRDLSILQQDQEFLTFIMKYQIVGTVVSTILLRLKWRKILFNNLTVTFMFSQPTS